MHQNLAIILQQFNYSKNSFIVLILDGLVIVGGGEGGGGVAVTHDAHLSRGRFEVKFL